MFRTLTPSSSLSDYFRLHYEDDVSSVSPSSERRATSRYTLGWRVCYHCLWRPKHDGLCCRFQKIFAAKYYSRCTSFSCHFSCYTLKWFENRSTLSKRQNKMVWIVSTGDRMCKKHLMQVNLNLSAFLVRNKLSGSKFTKVILANSFHRRNHQQGIFTDDARECARFGFRIEKKTSKMAFLTFII